MNQRLQTRRGRSGSRGDGKDHQRSGTSLLEWVCAGIGFALVCAAIGFIAYQGITHKDAPPQVSFSVASIVELDRGFVVSLRAINRGGRTLADVKVEGEIRGPSGSVETSEMSFSYLPPRSERKGGLFFTSDPRRYELKLTAKGFESP